MAEKTVKEATTNKEEGKEVKAEKKCNKGLIIGAIVAGIAIVIAVILIVVFVVVKPFNKNLTGKYDLTAMEIDGEDQSSSVALMKAFGMTATIEVENGKEGKISLFGDEAKFTYDGNTFHFEKKDDEEDEGFNGVDAKYETKDNTLTIIYSSEKDGEKSTEKLTFTKKAEDNK